jgi:murein DD-endopeptidase MepM/ murein hydrolase activator NlpD
LQSKAGGAYDEIVGNFKYAATEADKAGAVAAAMNYMMTHPKATIDQAIAEGNKYLNDNIDLAAAAETARENRRANGGYISGAGGPTDDKIPAMLSNGEYVVRASAVDQYGVGMLDSINTQKFATGGIVRPVSGRYNSGYPYNPPGHLGADFGGAGQEVHAAHSGNISYDEITMDPDGIHSARNKNPNRRYGDGFSSYGRVLRISGNGWTTLYAHLAKAIVKNGRVNQNDTIGISGQSGNAFGGHLHFEVKKDGSRINPMSAISGAYSGDTGADKTAADSLANMLPDGMPDSDALDRIATAMGTTASVFNEIKTNGLASVLTGRRFGGSMTMNKPYLVGENGPEVVMPYGAGGKVMPRFKVAMPSDALTGIAQASGDIINTTVGGDTVINLSVNGVNDPHLAARKVMDIIHMETKRRQFGRGA